MTVGEFQALLAELGRFLRALKAAGPAKEVEEVSAKLDAFKDCKLKAFGDLLTKAEEYARLGPQVKAPKARKPKADPAAIDQACLRLVRLHNQAIDPSTTLEAIEEAVQALQVLDPTKAKLEDLARKVGIGQKFGKKEDVLKAIRQKILSLKGAWDRRDA